VAALASRHDRKTTTASAEFVERLTDESSPDFVPRAERVAVFDNDGKLWCEKPMPVELALILRRFREMVAAHSSLAERQPWKPANGGDYAWLGGAVTMHYAGDDSVVKVRLQHGCGTLARGRRRGLDRREREERLGEGLLGSPGRRSAAYTIWG
jgi:hypothetical protein